MRSQEKSDGGEFRGADSESPHNSGRRAVIVLSGAGVTGVHVVTLESPGKVLKSQLVVDTAAYVDEDRIVDEAAGVQVADAGHGIDKGAPSSDIAGEPRTRHGVVLGDAASR